MLMDLCLFRQSKSSWLDRSTLLEQHLHGWCALNLASYIRWLCIHNSPVSSVYGQIGYAENDHTAARRFTPIDPDATTSHANKVFTASESLGATTSITILHSWARHQVPTQPFDVSLRISIQWLSSVASKMSSFVLGRMDLQNGFTGWGNDHSPDSRIGP